METEKAMGWGNLETVGWKPYRRAAVEVAVAPVWAGGE